MGAQVADSIYQAIRDDNLAAGAVLPSEAELAVTYGVSQRVVRDALRLLTRQGVIETRQGKRAAVGELRPVAVHDYFRLAVEANEDSMDDLIELRIALETRAVALAATRVTDDQLAELEELLASTVAATDPAERARADIAFHTAIVRAANNSFFNGIVEALVEVQIQAREREQSLTQEHGADHAENDAEHTALVGALKLRNPTLAEQSMHAHLEAVQQRLRAFDALSKGGDSG